VEKRLKILISSYACGPKWGSEIGMGWNWVIHLAQHCDLVVITELGFKKDIEEIIPTLNLNYLPVFHYIDIGVKGRDLFWKQGSFTFYSFYKKWQVNAYLLAKVLVRENKFDLIHQLNMIGFREPGFLWRIKEIPKIWGPIGGFTLMPWRFLPAIGVRSAIFFSFKNIYNILQTFGLVRVKKAFSNFDKLIAATLETQCKIESIYKKESILINETGAKSTPYKMAFKKTDEKLVLLWCGLITGRKALPIALKTLSKISNKETFEFHILGDGPDKEYCIKLAERLKISNQCTWYGQVSNYEVLEQMNISDLLFFTSLVEGTPHVVLEALACGLPVICHDTCGQGAVITDKCGIKIPVISPERSCALFSEEIENIIKHQDKLKILSNGALLRANELSWKNKAKEMIVQYQETIKRFQ
jgi:glycosyltransferase involved in cell wall biosynthesis